MNFRDSSCTGKVSYASKALAKLGLERLASGTGGHRATMNVYRCSFCCGWHIGHKRKDLWLTSVAAPHTVSQLG